MRTYFSENLIKIQQFSLKKMHVKMSSAKWRSSCLGLNVLMTIDCRELMSRVREDGHRIMDAQPSEATVGNMVRRGGSEDRRLQPSLFVTSNILATTKSLCYIKYFISRVRSTLKSAWILTLVLKSAWIWSEPWKLHKILEKCLNYSIPSLNFFSSQISEISHSVFCIGILYVEMLIILCFFAEFIFFWFSFNLVRQVTG